MSDEAIIVRRSTSDYLYDDCPFIFNSWLKSYRKSHFASGLCNAIYHKYQHELICKLIRRGTILIAHPKDEPTTILGWMHFEPNLIHFCLVKYDFYGLGVATALIKASGLDLNKCEFTHSTRDAAWIIKRFPALKYNPYRT